jgi:hypothetical protein
LKLDPHRPEKAAQPMLGRHVAREQGHGHAAEDRGDADDRPLRALEMWERGADAVGRAEQRDLDRPVEVVRRDLREGAVRGRGGVGNENVDAAEELRRLVDRGLEPLAVADIHGQRIGLDAAGVRELDGPLEPARHGRAGRGQRPRWRARARRRARCRYSRR